VTGACDERSPGGGGEKEEPKEPLPHSCRLRVLGGRRALPAIEDYVKAPFYDYNSVISRTGYMVKPVHMVYRTLSDGTKRVYLYYGRYWWRRSRGRLVYAGTEKPSRVKVEPPENPLAGHSIIVEGDDLIVDCVVYEKLRHILGGYSVVEAP